MSSPLGFDSARERREIRANVCRAARVAVEHRAHIVYSEGSQRWSGISRDRRAQHDEYPGIADCSALTTWCYWTYTRSFPHIGDFVNGLNWTGGYTGTMTQHGEQVSFASLLAADAIFYGGSMEIPAHVALYVGDGKVISHGGVAGDPQVYPINLFGALPLTQARRYIR